MEEALKEAFNDIKMISQGLEEKTVSADPEFSEVELAEIFDMAIELTVATKDALILLGQRA